MQGVDLRARRFRLAAMFMRFSHHPLLTSSPHFDDQLEADGQRLT
jgi:hypothetical protein